MTMAWVVCNIRWIMLAAGALTCTMTYVAVRALVLAMTGAGTLEHQVMVAIVTDSLMVLLFALYQLAPKPA